MVAPAVPAALVAIWKCIKLVISDKTVNTAVDHWTKGTSTKLDDLFWRLLEICAGIEDHDLQKLTLDAGLTDLNLRYASAKEVGLAHRFKEPVEPPISTEQLQALLTGDPITTV